MLSDVNYVGLSDGTVVCPRVVARLVPSKRWDMKRILGVRTTPMLSKTKSYDAIEEDPDPHTHPEVEDGIEPGED